MKNGKLKGFCSLFLTFAKIGFFTIGGGFAMMPMIKKELIDKRQWMTEEDLIDYYAIGQSTPGIVAVNVATFIGYKQFGILGGIVATIGIVFPSIVIICILASLISSISDFPIVQKALKGINVSVAALMTNVVCGFAKKNYKHYCGFYYLFMLFFDCFYF